MEVIFTLAEIGSAAKKFLTYAGDHKIFAFNGNVGAGKTTFITSLCKALGVKENISSPTFSIIQQYKTVNDQTIYHIDLYRLQDTEEAIQAGVEECLFSGKRCFVEWPEKAASLFPLDTVVVFLKIEDGVKRKLVINLPG